MIGLLVVACSLISGDDPALSLADLEAYRVALGAKPDPTAPLVRFRDLWDHPEAFAGRPLKIEGRLARIFRQPRLGEFPPLVEAWVVSKSGDPFCAVFADEAGSNSPEIGASVRFSGTFLRKIRYRGNDTDRIVPLIVGPLPPIDLAGERGSTRWSWSAIDWIMGLGVSGVIAVILMRRHLAGPVSRPTDRGPDPVFIDGDPEPEVESSEVEPGPGESYE